MMLHLLPRFQIIFATVFIMHGAISSAASADEAKFQECRGKLIKAQQIDLLYDMKWDKGKLPYVVVGPTFFTIPFDAKEGFAKTLSCFLTAGNTSECMTFDLLDYRTNNSVATFRNCTLKVK